MTDEQDQRTVHLVHLLHGDPRSQAIQAGVAGINARCIQIEHKKTLHTFLPQQNTVGRSGQSFPSQQNGLRVESAEEAYRRKFVNHEQSFPLSDARRRGR